MLNVERAYPPPIGADSGASPCGFAFSAALFKTFVSKLLADSGCGCGFAMSVTKNCCSRGRIFEANCILLAGRSVRGGSFASKCFMANSVGLSGLCVVNSTNSSLSMSLILCFLTYAFSTSVGIFLKCRMYS